LSEQRAARILIAEDEANLRLVLQKELERLGYRVQAAPDGEAALRKLEESNVDVLLCDINMPRIDGMEVLRRVHERPNPPEVIMLTGQALTIISPSLTALRNSTCASGKRPRSGVCVSTIFVCVNNWRDSLACLKSFPFPPQ
jgi:CheY-like chemotaxis protein